MNTLIIYMVTTSGIEKIRYPWTPKFRDEDCQSKETRAKEKDERDGAEMSWINWRLKEEMIVHFVTQKKNY